MREPRLVELLLSACDEAGALRLRDLYRDVALLAGDKEFTSAEICAHAALARNYRLRVAMEAVLGADFGAGKLGKLFARFEGVSVDGIAITAIGAEANAVLWRARVNAKRTPAADTSTLAPLSNIMERRNAG